MREWKGSVAFITGGGQGIGLGIARALAKRGVRLALADIDEAALASSKGELSALTGVETYRLDVRDREAFAAVADEAESSLGPVDLLFNNAGIAPYSSLRRMRYEQWDLVMGVNVHGVINGVQTFMPRMIERGKGGYVVNTASGAGLVAGPNVLYTTSKYAVVGMSESLKHAAAKYGIDVSVLCPAAVATNILHNTDALGSAAGLGQRTDARKSTEDYISSGLSIDVVGEMVLDGMESKATWILTDSEIEPYVKMRAEALLDAFPAAASGVV
ncbi:SDR family oxidoreductase [Dactylosporangium sp. CA-233914]|uniref:SDR family oxidoreductase n=1 Tax=Dactylosporangium sp. CA-233914 TaxID=3239934 RepID=UPI003D8C987A